MSAEETGKLKRAMTVLLLCITACLLSARLLYLYLNDTHRFPINTIQVIASYQHITHQQLQSIFEPFQQKSFYTYPVHQLYNQLMTLPWAAEVEIERLFPDSLKITIKEKEPLATWNHFILTKQGDYFSDNTALPQLASLPHFTSSPQDLKIVLQMYQKMSKILAINQLSIKKLERRENHAWDVTLTNGILLKLGKQDTYERVERFCQAYPLLSERPGQLIRVDLRYSKGMAAKWQS